jgi:hypothetical protein
METKRNFPLLGGAMERTFKIRLCVVCTSTDIDMDACTVSKLVSSNTDLLTHL